MKLLLRLMLLLSMGWIGYANIHLLGAAADAIGKTSDTAGMKMQMAQIGQMLQMEYVSSNTLVTGNLLSLIRQNVEASGRNVTNQTGRDVWGTPYHAMPTARGVAVCSAGADKKWNTRDDLRFQQVLLDYKPPANLPTKVLAQDAAAPAARPAAAANAMATTRAAVAAHVATVTPETGSEAAPAAPAATEAAPEIVKSKRPKAPAPKAAPTPRRPKGIIRE